MDEDILNCTVNVPRYTQHCLQNFDPKQFL